MTGQGRDLLAAGRAAAGKLGLAVAAVLVTLVVLELLLSAFFEPVLKVWQVQEIFQLDDELTYSLKPGRERTARAEEFVEHVTTNSDGLRDDEIQPRGAFEKRIVVLGDSMVFGHGVDDHETLPNQLEALYRDEKRPIDVINAGVKGYGTDGAYKLFQARLRPLALEPDLVVFAIYHNDLHDNVGQPLYTIENGSLAPLDPTRNWIYLLGSLENRTPAFLRNRILYGLVLSRFVGRDVYSVLPDLDEAGLAHWAAEKAALQVVDLTRLGSREGFRLLTLCIPYRDGPPGFYGWLAPLRERGVWVFDPSVDPAWEEEKGRFFFAKDTHLTPAGNRKLAEAVRGVLDRAGF